MSKSYKNIGICLFCKKSEPEVTFSARPHTIPKQMGGRNIGFDICDECNHYFGTVDKSITPNLSVEVCVKEILNLTKYVVDMVRAHSIGKKLPYHKSIYFNVYQSENLIQFKRQFSTKRFFSYQFTRCFKRGLYEFFLQEYHRQTRDGLDERFDAIRRFARYNEGDVPVWHMQYNPIGVHPMCDESEGLEIPITAEAIENINTYGIFRLFIRGFWFYLAVVPHTNEVYWQYLKQEDEEMTSGAIFRGVIELNNVLEIDFTLSRFNRE